MSSFYLIKCISDGIERFVTDPVDGVDALSARNLPLDRYRIEFQCESKIIFRQAAPCGKYWCLDQQRRKILLGFKPEPFKYRLASGSNAAEFFLESESGVCISLSFNFQFILEAGTAVRFALYVANTMELANQIPRPFIVDLVSDLSDKAYRSTVISWNVQCCDERIKPKPILMRKRMPMSSSTMIDLLTRLARLLRQMPLPQLLESKLSFASSIDFLATTLQSAAQVREPLNMATLSKNFDVKYETVEKRFIEEQRIQLDQRPSWHNAKMQAQIDELVEMELGEPFVKISNAVVSMFQIT